LVLLPAQGGDFKEIVDGLFTDIAWMPEGDALVAYGLLSQSEEGVFYVDLMDGEVHPIGISERISLGLDVHPDGHRIAYTSGSTGSELWVLENFLPEGDAANRSETSSR
jgi:hypothetical protein